MPSRTDAAPKAPSVDKGGAVVTDRAVDGLPSFNPSKPPVAHSEIPDPISQEISLFQAHEDKPSKEGIQTVEFKTGRHAGERDVAAEHRETAHELEAEEPSAAVPLDQRQGKKSLHSVTEAIDRSDVGVPEAHTILLKGVQAWIAAGPATPEKHEVMKAKIQAPPPGEQAEMAQSWDSEPGVVRIGRTDRPEFRPHERPMKATPDIQEQVFDLSIGTISVVIEDDTKSPQRAPLQQSESGRGKRESRPSSSRLSRNYI